MSNIQSYFLHWIEVYDWVFSLPDNERPIDRVVDNDEAFDTWYKSYVAQKNKEYSGTGGKGGTASKHENVIKF